MCNSGWCNYGFVIACFLLQLLLKKGKRILNTEQHRNTCNWPFCIKKGFLSHRAGKAQLGFRQQGCSQVTYPAHPGYRLIFMGWGMGTGPAQRDFISVVPNTTAASQNNHKKNLPFTQVSSSLLEGHLWFGGFSPAIRLGQSEGISVQPKKKKKREVLFLTARSASEFIAQLHEQLYEQDEGAQEQGQTFQSHILKDCCKDCETAFQPFPTPLRTGPLAALLPMALESFALLISMPRVLADLCSMLPSPERHICGRRPQIFFCSAHTQLRSSICLGKNRVMETYLVCR